MKYVTEPKPKAPMFLDKYIGFTQIVRESPFL